MTNTPFLLCIGAILIGYFQRTARYSTHYHPSPPPRHLPIRQRSLQLRVLAPRRAQEVTHAHRRRPVRRQERRVERDVADVPPCHLQPRELVHVQPLGRRAGREHMLPDPPALLRVRERELHYEPQAAQERRVERV